MTHLTKDAILAAPDRVPVTVAVPEWGGAVRLQPLDGRGRERLLRAITAATDAPTSADAEQLAATLVAECLIDDAGARLFDTPEAVAALATKNGAVLRRLLDVVLEINGLGTRGEAAAGNDSTPTPTTSSASS